MDKFLSHKRTFDDNKASTSAQTSIVPKIKSRKYSQEYLNFGFTITEVNGEEKPLCVICSKILAADSMKPNKLKRHFETLHAIEIVETMFGDNFAKELQSIPLSNDTVSRRIDDIAEDVEQQLFAGCVAWLAFCTRGCGFNPQSKSVDFHDAENQQWPCRMIMRHTSDTHLWGGNWASKLPTAIGIRLYGAALKRDTSSQGMYKVLRTVDSFRRPEMVLRNKLFFILELFVVGGKWNSIRIRL
ncbi:DUF4371 domain-containing protein [Trichonephila clavipes]|nr:DUF4371 domain-containing protein [Trichonephila clavipes]